MEWNSTIFKSIEAYGGTLASDAMKSRKRSTNNTTLVFREGALFVQSTHTLGARKTTLWVFNDIKKAIEIVGIQYISFVVLDGACAAVLKMIDTDLQKVFGIRCVTHAWSLLCKDLCSLFEDEVKICTKLIQFVVNHDFMYNYLTVTLKAAHLVEVADARFATLVYAIERIIADKAALRSLWFSQDTIVWVGTQTTAIKDAFNYLERNRQEHLVTEAYVKIQNSLKIEASYKKSKVEHVPFLQRIKEHFSEKKQEISDRFDIEEEERIAQEEERMAQEEDEKARDEEDTVPLDDEYANDEDVEEFFNAFIEENIIAMSEYSV
jgi:hypothetical protein